MFTMDDEDTEETVQDQVDQPGTVLDVVLCRQSGAGFGLNIVGGIDSKEFGYDNGIFISSINPGGPADMCGDLDVGDRLLQINELSLIEVTHVEAVDAFRNAGEITTLKIEKFAQQLVIGKLSVDSVDGPRPCNSTTTSQQLKIFMNSWGGAMIIGTVAGMAVMFTVNRLYRALK